MLRFGGEPDNEVVRSRDSWPIPDGSGMGSLVSLGVIWIVRANDYVGLACMRIGLEQVSQPKIRGMQPNAELDILVWHDDQQGTAAVTLAGPLNPVKVVVKPRQAMKIAMIGGRRREDFGLARPHRGGLSCRSPDDGRYQRPPASGPR
jgi:hypothetical protein